MTLNPLSLIAPDADALGDLIGHFPVGVVLIDPNLVALFWSSRCETLFGWRADEVVGRPIASTFSRGLESGVQGIRERLSAPVDGAAPAVVESATPIRARDGSELICRFTTIALRDRDGGLSGFLAVAQDVTARERALADLRASEQWLETLTRNLPVGVFRASPEGRCEYVNPCWCEWTGLSPEESRGTGWFAAVHPDDLPAVRDFWNSAIARNASDTSEHRLRHRDGRIVWVLGHLRPLQGPDGRPIGCIGTLINLTERRRVEQELRIAATAFDLQEGIVVTDASSTILRVNRTFCDLTGYRADEMVGRLSRDLRADPIDDRTFRQWIAYLDAEGHWSGEVDHRRKNGEVFPCWLSVAAVKDAKGRISHLVGSFVDITERKRAEAARIAAQRELWLLNRRMMEQEKQTTRRLAQALHDRLGQTLAAIRLQTDALQAVQASSRLMAGPAATLARVSALVDQAVQEVRAVLVDLRPPLLDEQGLASALDNEMKVRLRDAGDVQLRMRIGSGVAGLRWPADVEYAAFMIAREAIGNALRHAHASTITCRLDGDVTSLHLRISDDGSGLPGPTERPGHLGVVGMRERALAIDAAFEMRSRAGAGVTVTLDWRAAP